MEFVRAMAVRWVDGEWPGWVQVQFTEVDGSSAVVIDKVPIFDHEDRLVPGVRLPVQLDVACEVLSRGIDVDGQESVAVMLRHGAADRAGRTIFRVAADQVVTLP